RQLFDRDRMRLAGDPAHRHQRPAAQPAHVRRRPAGAERLVRGRDQHRQHHRLQRPAGQLITPRKDAHMSFDIALTGINAINTQLETISNNIANSATYGFKTSRANFAAVVAGTQSNGSEVASMTQSMDIGGGLLNTGRAMDAAIQGRGFFVLRDTNGAYQYSRVGIFSADRNGMLVDNVGRRLQGYPITPGGTTMNSMGDLSLPIGQIPAQATTRMQYVGNLSSDWAVPTTPFNTADPSSYNGSMVAVVYDSLGAQHSMTQYFVKSAGNEVTVHYTIDGATLPATSTLNFGTDGQLLGPVGAVNVAL